MDSRYGTIYKAMSDGYKSNKFLILKRFGKPGSYIYEPKNRVEDINLALMLELLISDNWEIVVTNSPETYSEYAPYTTISDVKQFITLAMSTE